MMKNTALISVFALLLSGCAHYMPAAISSTSIGSKYEVPVKTVTGTSSAYYVFGFGPTGDDSLNAAIEDAKSNAPSDSIANVFVDRKLTCFPVCGFSVFTRIDTMIYGTLVKYTKEDGAPLMPKEEKTDEANQVGEIRSSFADFKKGDVLTIIFKKDPDGRKSGIDGNYEFLSMEGAGSICAVFKPISGGIFSGKVFCPGAIGIISRN